MEARNLDGPFTLSVAQYLEMIAPRSCHASMRIRNVVQDAFHHLRQLNGFQRKGIKGLLRLVPRSIGPINSACQKELFVMGTVELISHPVDNLMLCHVFVVNGQGPQSKCRVHWMPSKGRPSGDGSLGRVFVFVGKCLFHNAGAGNCRDRSCWSQSPRTHAA